ncbi:hypothetical protein AA18895_0790 [Acetobacter ghanensis DSM 18895]|nr:hypothetical protein AA18895_0790 [Acetobacter ghanensis DSM 18895]
MKLSLYTVEFTVWDNGVRHLRASLWAFHEDDAKRRVKLAYADTSDFEFYSVEKGE